MNTEWKANVLKQIVLLILVLAGSIAFSSQPVWAGEAKVAESTDGAHIAYTVYGEGRHALVFVHGWSCDQRYWKNQIDFFSKNHRVITIDLAGHGHSSQERENYTIDLFGHDVKAVLEREQIDGAVLIGHSLGGPVIAKAASLLPGRVLTLIGVDTFHNVEHPLPEEEREAMVQPIKADFKTGVSQLVRGMLPENADPELVEWIAADMSSAPARVGLSAFTNYFGWFTSGESTQTFEALNIPVYALNAHLWPTSPEDNRKHIKSFEAIYISDAGHFVQLEAPDRFNTALAKILQKYE